MKIGIVFLVLAIALTAAEISWDACVRTAAAKNPTIIAEKEKLTAARANAFTAASGVLPAISASASATASLTPSYAYGVNARQLIFDGSKIASLPKASEEVRVAELSYMLASADIRYTLRSAYIAVMKAERFMQTTKAIVSLREKQVALVTLRYDAGREHKGSLFSARADAAQAKFESEQAQRSLASAQTTLADLLCHSDTGLSAVIDASESTTGEPDYAAIASNYPGVQIASAKRRIAEQTYWTTIGALTPSLYANASVGKNSASESIQWSAGVSFSLPLFDGGASIAQSVAANAGIAQAVAEETAALRDRRTMLTAAWNALVDARGQLSVQREHLAANEERAVIADAQYTTGLIDFNNWTIIQNALVNSQKTIITATADVHTAEAAWQRAQGVPLENEKN